jgi:tetratricopeptide (TPR) repeat protein
MLKGCDINTKNNPSSLESAASYNNLGMLYAERGDNEKAEEHFLKSISIKEMKLTKMSPVLATSYLNVGVLFADLKELQKAETWLLKAMAIYEATLDSSSPDLLVLYGRLAEVYHALDDTDKGLLYDRKARSRGPTF